MIIIEVIEESGLGALGGLLVLILVICLLVNSCNGSAATTTDKVDHVETVETVATIPEVASLTSLHILGTHSNVLDNIENGSVKDAYGKTYTGPFFDLCSYGNYAGDVRPAGIDSALEKTKNSITLNRTSGAATRQRRLRIYS